MKKYIAVFDETGTNNRPQSVEESGFGVGAIIFPSEHTSALASISKEIGSTIREKGFKCKDVHNNEAARKLFIKALNSTDPPVHLFAFYAHGGCMVHEKQRTKEAAATYGTEFEQPSSPRGDEFIPFDSFIAYMASCIGAHAATNRYAVDIYWDRRTDLEEMKASFSEHIAAQSDTVRYRGVADQVTFCGSATKELYPIVRLSGVLAGDVWKYFSTYGGKIWSKLDPGGLIGEYDPHLDIDDPLVNGPTCVATMRERLADAGPSRLVAPVMLQGYYKRFLKSEEREHLISFGAPNGRSASSEFAMAIIGIFTNWLTKASSSEDFLLPRCYQDRTNHPHLAPCQEHPG